MASIEDAAALASDLPAVKVTTSYGTPSLEVKGKSFCRMWSDREHDRDDVHDTEVLVVFCDVDEKGMLIDNAGGVLFSTPHYEGFGAVLVRLAEVALPDLADYLEGSYRLKAPKELLAELDAH